MGQKSSIENDMSSGHNLSQKHTFDDDDDLTLFVVVVEAIVS